MLRDLSSGTDDPFNAEAAIPQQPRRISGFNSNAGGFLYLLENPRISRHNGVPRTAR